MIEGAVYRRIADELRARIISGEFASGAYLPALPDLAHAYGVGRDTIKRALDMLERDGLIERRAGFRARVRPRREPQVIVAARGSTVRARPATAQERAEHSIPEGVWVLQLVDAQGVGDVYPADHVTVRFE